MKHIFIYNPAAGRDNKAAVEYLRQKMSSDYSHLSYEKVIRDNLKATDLTAITLCREQELPILCFALDKLEEAVECENVGTLIDSRP